MSGSKMDRDKWSQLTIYEQLGNIGSEVGRAINARRNGDDDRMEGAINRALDLFLATIESLINEKTYIHRAKEVIRMRDDFMSLFYHNYFDEKEAWKIESYFMNFAYMARMQTLENRR